MRTKTIEYNICYIQCHRQLFVTYQSASQLHAGCDCNTPGARKPFKILVLVGFLIFLRTYSETYKITKTRFDKNKALYKKLYDFDFGVDKSVFDLIINTDNLTAQQVIDVTKETVRKLL